MNKLPTLARILLGLIFVVFGLNGFFHFLPMPPMPEKAAAFAGALFSSGYFFPFLKTIEVICGVLLLVGAFVPLALVVLAPIIANIFMFHAFLAPSGLPLPIIIGLLEIYLAFFAEPYSSIVKQIFRCPKKEAMDAK
jgi:putative oxidoreductase